MVAAGGSTPPVEVEDDPDPDPGIVGLGLLGGTVNEPPFGHQDPGGAQVGPGLPPVTPAAGDGATFDGLMPDSSLPLKDETANA